MCQSVINTLLVWALVSLKDAPVHQIMMSQKVNTLLIIFFVAKTKILIIGLYYCCSINCKKLYAALRSLSLVIFLDCLWTVYSRIDACHLMLWLYAWLNLTPLCTVYQLILWTNTCFFLFQKYMFFENKWTFTKFFLKNHKFTSLDRLGLWKTLFEEQFPSFTASLRSFWHYNKFHLFAQKLKNTKNLTPPIWGTNRGG